MRCRRFLLLFIGVLLLDPTPARAQSEWQQLQEKGLNLWNESLQPDPGLDPEWIFQPAKNWCFSSGYELNRMGVRLISEIDFQEDTRQVDSRVGVRLLDPAAHHVGASVGFGPVSLGYSREVGRKTGSNSSFSFQYISTHYGGEIRYSKYSNTLAATLSLDMDGDGQYNLEEYDMTEFLSDQPGDMVNFILSGFYAFNKERFCYISAYDGKMVQRRSAGSWLVAAKYMQVKLKIAPEDAMILDILQGTGQYRTFQFSLGGGYSFNWVPFHRDPADARDLRTLRNLTVNFTVMPLLTVFNETISYSYLHIAPYVYSDRVVGRYPLLGSLQPNFIASTGVNYAFGHFFVNLWSDFDLLHFTSPDKFDAESGDDHYNITQDGVFSNWRLALVLSYRF